MDSSDGQMSKTKQKQQMLPEDSQSLLISLWHYLFFLGDPYELSFHKFMCPPDAADCSWHWFVMAVTVVTIFSLNPLYLDIAITITKRNEISF